MNNNQLGYNKLQIRIYGLEKNEYHTPHTTTMYDGMWGESGWCKAGI